MAAAISFHKTHFQTISWNLSSTLSDLRLNVVHLKVLKLKVLKLKVSGCRFRSFSMSVGFVAATLYTIVSMCPSIWWCYMTRYVSWLLGLAGWFGRCSLAESRKEDATEAAIERWLQSMQSPSGSHCCEHMKDFTNRLETEYAEAKAKATTSGQNWAVRHNGWVSFFEWVTASEQSWVSTIAGKRFPRPFSSTTICCMIGTHVYIPLAISRHSGISICFVYGWSSYNASVKFASNGRYISEVASCGGVGPPAGIDWSAEWHVTPHAWNKPVDGLTQPYKSKTSFTAVLTNTGT